MVCLIPAMLVSTSSDTNKNSSATSRKFHGHLLALLVWFSCDSAVFAFWSAFYCALWVSLFSCVECLNCRVVSNFAFSFSIISVLTGITTLYNNGLNFGGPVSLVYGWFIAGFFTMFVGLSMAEICSSYPTSGGLYYWSAKLAGPSWAPFASWMTGW